MRDDADLNGGSLAKLVRSVGVLALPYPSQQAWLVGVWDIAGVAPIDELATEFGDSAELADQFLEAKWILPTALEKVKVLDAYLDERSGTEDSDFWTYEALRDHPGWEHIRKLALDVLIELD